MEETSISYTEFIQPELLVLVPVLMFIGAVLKASGKVGGAAIPVCLGIAGMLLSALRVTAVTAFHTPQSVLLGIFTAIVQGLLCAGAAVYGHQIWKQGRSQKTDKKSETDCR